VLTVAKSTMVTVIPLVADDFLQSRGVLVVGLRHLDLLGRGNGGLDDAARVALVAPCRLAATSAPVSRAVACSAWLARRLAFTGFGRMDWTVALNAREASVTLPKPKCKSAPVAFSMPSVRIPTPSPTLTWDKMRDKKA
jgi:hypothetical protein